MEDYINQLYINFFAKYKKKSVEDISNSNQYYSRSKFIVYILISTNIIVYKGIYNSI